MDKHRKSGGSNNTNNNRNSQSSFNSRNKNCANCGISIHDNRGSGNICYNCNRNRDSQHVNEDTLNNTSDSSVRNSVGSSLSTEGRLPSLNNSVLDNYERDVMAKEFKAMRMRERGQRNERSTNDSTPRTGSRETQNASDDSFKDQFHQTLVGSDRDVGDDKKDYGAPHMPIYDAFVTDQSPSKKSESSQKQQTSASNHRKEIYSALLKKPKNTPTRPAGREDVIALTEGIQRFVEITSQGERRSRSEMDNEGMYF